MLEKQCRVCNKSKYLSEFGNHSYTKDGYRADCKPCARQACIDYKRSKDGIISKIYSNQKIHAKERGMDLPTYSKEELREWLYSQEKFHVLYDNYQRLDYQRDYVPSVDRKDDYISYTMDNIQLLTFKGNMDKSYSDIINGINLKSSRSILQFSMDGEFIREWFSATEAQRKLNIKSANICKCCTGKRNHAGGYVWKHKE